MFTTIIIQLTARGIGNIVLTNRVPQTATVEDLEQILQDRENGMLTNVKFTYLGKTMTDKKKKLSFYKVRNNSIIFCPMRLKGGTQAPKITEYQTKQLTDRTSNVEILPQSIESMFNKSRLQTYNITLVDKICANRVNESCDCQSITRFKMPKCEKDHIQCYNCLKQYIYKGLFINGDNILECRNKCGEFDFDALSAVLNWSDKDEQLILQALNTNNMKYANMKACPNSKCGQYIIKDETIKGYRVNCSSCDGKDFCWKCLKEWKASGNDDCGDDECKYNYMQYVSKLLENSDTRDSIYTDTKKIPVMRLCPGCKTLFEWGEQCRHITCPQDDCGHNYCQSCLRPFEVTDGCKCRYCRTIFKDKPLCSLKKPCTVAPIQKTQEQN
jgi:hypothetical protein